MHLTAPVDTSPGSRPVRASAVRAEGLRHRYGERVALDGVSFSVDSGELFGILGPNGGGKSTLFRILCTLVPPAEGTLLLSGRNPARELTAVRRGLGVVFQAASLDPYLTTEENLRHQGHLYGLSGRSLRTRTEEMLEQFALADRRRERVSRLSGGLRRRVEIAKALLHRPDILILDEPSTGLDPAARRDMWKHLEGLARDAGTTVVFTTHFMDEADRADRLLVLERGRAIAEDTPEALRRLVGGDVLTIEAADPEDLSREVATRYGVETTLVDGRVRVERAQGHEFLAVIIEAFPGRIRSITVGKPTLEDAFIHLTGHPLLETEGADPGDPGPKPVAARAGRRR